MNHYAGIELAGNRVFVRFALDLAEIPTLQVGDAVRRPGFAASVARQLDLRIGGTRVPLVPMRSSRDGAGGAAGLPTLRFDAVYRALRYGEASSRSPIATYPNRIGWREITVTARDGARVLPPRHRRSSRSDELRAYPDELLASPLDVRSAVARSRPAPRQVRRRSSRRPPRLPTAAAGSRR